MNSDNQQKESKQRKTTGRLALYLFGGVTLGAVGATSAYFLVEMSQNHDSQSGGFIPGGGGPGSTQPQTIKVSELHNLELTERDSQVPGMQRVLFTPIKDANGNQVADAPVEYLKQDLITRLGFGPEIDMLKGIRFVGITQSWGSDANGLYIGNTNEIFINTKSIIEGLINIGAVQTKVINGQKTVTKIMTGNNPAQWSKAVAEMMFEVIFHEYGHHMAYVYLNSDFRKDNIPPTTISSVSETGDVDSATWDTNFLNQFKSTLSYDNNGSWVPNNSNIHYRWNNNGNSSDYPVSDVYPLNSSLSVKDLWDYSNSATAAVRDKVDQSFNAKNYRPFGAKSYQLAQNNGPVFFFPFELPYIKKGAIIYWYNQDELFTRKFMQATMRFPSDGTVNQYGLVDFPSYSDGNYVYKPSWLSTSLEDTFMYADNTSMNDNSIFYPDYLFKKNGLAIDASHADAIYDAFVDRTGFASADDLSEVFYQNDTIINQNAKLVYESNLAPVQDGPHATSMIKFGGYIPQNSSYKYVGYFENNNPLLPFHSWPIFVDDYNIKVKSRLMDSNGSLPNAPQDKAFYVTNDWIDAKELNNKALYFADDASGASASPLQTYNAKASTDTGKWDQSTAFQRYVVHPISITGGKVALLREQS